MPIRPAIGPRIAPCGSSRSPAAARDIHVDAAGEWTLAQPTRLGVPTLVVEIFGGAVDWQRLDQLVARGCPLSTALEIVR
jgi:hypothetical protein